MPSLFGGGQVQTWVLQSESQSLLQGPLPEPNLFNDSGSFEGVYGLPGSHSGHRRSTSLDDSRAGGSSTATLSSASVWPCTARPSSAPTARLLEARTGLPAASGTEAVNIQHDLLDEVVDSPAVRIYWAADRQQAS